MSKENKISSVRETLGAFVGSALLIGGAYITFKDSALVQKFNDNMDVTAAYEKAEKIAVENKTGQERVIRFSYGAGY